MTLRTPTDIAASLARLHDAEFDGKKRGAFIVEINNFKKLAGRTHLKQSVVDEIAESLLRDHRLLLARSDSFFAVVSEKVASGWRTASGVKFAAECRRKSSTGFNPQAAWPFPTGSRT